MGMNKRLDELLELQRDRQLAPPQQTELERLLVEDSAAAQQWRATQSFDQRFGTTLQARLDSAHLSAAAVARMRARLRRTARPSVAVMLAAVCATLAVLIVAWVVLRALVFAPATVAPPVNLGAEETAQANDAARATVQAIYAANATARAGFYATATARPGAAEEATRRAIEQATSDAWTPTPTLANNEATATAQMMQSSAVALTPNDVGMPATMTALTEINLTEIAVPESARTATAEVIIAEQTATALTQGTATPLSYLPPAPSTPLASTATATPTATAMPRPGEAESPATATTQAQLTATALTP